MLNPSSPLPLSSPRVFGLTAGEAASLCDLAFTAGLAVETGVGADGERTVTMVDSDAGGELGRRTELTVTRRHNQVLASGPSLVPMTAATRFEDVLRQLRQLLPKRMLHAV